MTSVEEICFWACVAFYIAASILFVAGGVFGRAKWTSTAVLVTVAGLAAHTGALTSRWIAVGHPPVMRNYENAMAGAWVICAGFLALALKNRRTAFIGVTTLPICLLMMGYGVMNFPMLEPFTPPHKSGWLFVHVIFAWFSHMSFVIAFGLSFSYILKERKERRGEAVAAGRGLPLAALDDLSYRFIAFGFIMDTIMIISGAIWASRLWGSYWNWDPVETWSLISWLLYALYLHLRVTMKWRGRRAAWLAVIALVGVIISFWGVNYIQASRHIFNLL